ncbi:hypothetical protein C0993_009829, partial [Termitomyces sp. T159_Od127]
MPAGSLIGALMVTQLADRLGRKKTVTLAGIVWVIGSILQCASIVSNQINAVETCKGDILSTHQNRGILVVGRIISGISVGLASAVVHIYQSEITLPSIRGRIISLQQWEEEALQVLADLHGGGDKNNELVVLEVNDTLFP